MSIVLMGSTSGSCTLQEQAVAGTTTLTLPTTSGTVALTTDIVAPTTAQVLNATAGLTAGGVGTYALLEAQSGSGANFGVTNAGSILFPTNIFQNDQALAQAGTWRSLGFNQVGGGSLWVRIS